MRLNELWFLGFLLLLMGTPYTSTAKIGLSQITDIDLTIYPNTTFALSAATHGDTITLKTTLQHAGTEQIVFNVKYAWYLSTDNIINPATDTLIQQFNQFQADYGVTDPRTDQATLSVSLPTGTFYIGVYYDMDYQVTETNENNNWAIASNQITISGRVDFQADSVTGPASMTTGDTISVNVQFQNVGTKAETGVWLYVYLSTDSSLSASDTYFGGKLHNVYMAPSYTSGVVSISITSSSTLTPGVYYLIFQIDGTNFYPEASENNNIAVSTSTITVSTPFDVKAIGVSLNTNSINAGDLLTVTPSIQNSGTAALSNILVKIYLSTDTIITTSDTFLKSYTIISLAASATHTQGYSVTVSISTGSGTYYIGVLADPNNDISEFAENNNKAVSTALTVSSPFDVSTTGLSLSSTSVNAGGTLTVTPTIKNSGTSTLSIVLVNIYLSSDNVITTSDKFLKTYTISNLAPLATHTLGYSVTIPVSMGSGTYYIGVLADPNNDISEFAENNNARSATIIVTGVIDLYVNLVGSDVLYFPGESNSVSVTITNAGGVTTGSFTVSLYLSVDTTITPGVDTWLVDQTVNSLLSSTTFSMTFILPYVTGTFYFGVIVDNTAVVAETNENNNVRVSNYFLIGWHDNNQDFDTADPIAHGDVSGELNSTDRLDYLTFDAVKDQVIKLNFTSTGLVYIYAYSPSRVFIQSDTLGTDLFLTFSASVNGSYFVKFLLLAGSSGSYSGSLSLVTPEPPLLPEDNEEFGTADPLLEGVFTGDINSPDINDYYSVTLAKGDYLKVVIDTTFSGAVLSLYSPTETLLETKKNSNHLVIIFLADAGGNYYIRIYRSVASGFSYTGSISISQDSDGSVVSAQTVIPGSYSGDVSIVDWYDYYKISVPDNTTITISWSTSGDGYNTYVSVSFIATSGSTLKWSNGVFGEISYSLENGGTYYILITNDDHVNQTYSGVISFANYVPPIPPVVIIPGDSMENAISSYKYTTSGSFPGPAKDGGTWYYLNLTNIRDNIVLKYNLTVSGAGESGEFFIYDEGGNVLLHILSNEVGFFSPDPDVDIYYMLVLPSSPTHSGVFRLNMISTFPGKESEIAIKFTAPASLENSAGDSWFVTNVNSGDIFKFVLNTNSFSDFIIKFYDKDLVLLKEAKFTRTRNTMYLTVDYTGKFYISVDAPGNPGYSIDVTVTKSTSSSSTAKDSDSTSSAEISTFGFLPVIFFAFAITLLIKPNRRKNIADFV